MNWFVKENNATTASQPKKTRKRGFSSTLHSQAGQGRSFEIEQHVNAVCLGKLILRRIGRRRGFGSAGAFPRRWNPL